MKDLIAKCADLPAEQSVLGACLFRPGILDWLELDDRDFFDPKNQTVWKAVRAVYERDRALDEVLVAGELAKRNVLDAVGGPPRLAELAMLVPTADNVEHYARQLRVKRLTRDVLVAAGEIESFCKGGVEGEELLGEAQAILARIGVPDQNRVTTMAELITDEIRRMDEVSKARREGREIHSGLPTGISGIDERVASIPLGLVSVICGRPADGKSTLANTIAANVARSGQCAVAILSYEDPGEVYARRTLAADSGVEVQRLQACEIQHGDMVPIRAAKGRSDEQLVHCHFVRAHGLPVTRAFRLGLARGRERRVQLLVLDYVQNAVRPRPGQKKHEAIEEVMQEAQWLAAKENVAVLVVSQLNREIEKRNDGPKMSDMKDAGAIEQCAKLILAIGKAKEKTGEPRHGFASISVVKNNAGESGYTFQIPFEPEKARFPVDQS